MKRPPFKLHRVIFTRLHTCSAALAVTGATLAFAQGSGQPTLSPGASFIEQSGEALYANICQACHMEDGKGAVGAGLYPAIANNLKLVTRSYPVYVVLHGSRAMPPMEKLLSDEQVAAVVNYIRTHFGNAYADSVSAREVSGAR
jgi:mono/diheme cytochrome c family protein